MTPAELTTLLKTEAQRLGFDLAGACPAVAAPGIDGLRQWLEAGYAGQMHYFAERAEAYQHPRHLLDGVQSLLMLAVGYRTLPRQSPQAGQGAVSSYAWGSDYHEVIRDRLHQLADFHRRLTPTAQTRGVVDTAPLLERQFAQLAGLGWIGKNTLLLNREWGSWFFLAALLTTEELVYDAPLGVDHCGTCRACIDACPTAALESPGRLDARKCISYLTIELKEAVADPLRPGLGEWLFGCDVCQDVCPWNRRVPESREPRFLPAEGMNPVALAELFFLDDAEFRRRFGHTPLTRPKRLGLLRNAAYVLGNKPVEAAVPGLIHGLNDADPLVRSACAWALEQARGQGIGVARP